MPRERQFKSDLPGNEVDTCLRLQHARVTLQLSQAEVATALQVSRESVTSYEAARLAVPFDFALKFCQMFIVSEKWLAEGSSNFGMLEDDRRLMSLITEPECWQFPPRTSFASAWEMALSSIYKKVEARIAPRVERIVFPRGKEPEAAKYLVESSIRTRLQTLAKTDASTERDLPLPTLRFAMAIISVAREIDCAVSAENIELTNYEAVAFNDWLVESGKLTLEELHSMDGAEHARTIMRFARRFLIEFYSHFS